MQIRTHYISLNHQEASQLVAEIKRKKCQTCKNAAALGSGGRVCMKGFTFPACYHAGEYRLEDLI